MTVRVVIMARFPVPGACKTRLIPRFGPDGAASIHRTLTEKTLNIVRQSSLRYELWGTGASEDAFQDWLGPIDFRQQPTGDLGARLQRAADPYPVIFLGTDCPGLTSQHLQDAAQHLEGGAAAVLGPAEDGGYWTLGISRAIPGVFQDIPWGTSEVYALTYQRLEAAGASPVVLPRLADIDYPEDLDPWPELHP